MSNTKTYTPFTFTTSFDELEKSDLQILEEERERAAEDEKERLRLEEEAKTAPPPPPTFSEEELAQAKAEAWEEGHNAGKTEALGQIEQATMTALQTLTGYLAVLQDRQALANESQAAALARISSDMVRKLMPVFAREHGVEEIKSLVYASLTPLETKGRINITVPEDLHGPIQEHLQNVAQEAGFEGKLMYHPDAKLGPSDVRVDWGRGSAERNVEAAMAEMDKVVAEFLETHGTTEAIEEELAAEEDQATETSSVSEEQPLAPAMDTEAHEVNEAPVASPDMPEMPAAPEADINPETDVNMETESQMPTEAPAPPPEEPNT